MKKRACVCVWCPMDAVTDIVLSVLVTCLLLCLERLSSDVQDVLRTSRTLLSMTTLNVLNILKISELEERVSKLQKEKRALEIDAEQLRRYIDATRMRFDDLLDEVHELRIKRCGNCRWCAAFPCVC